MVINQEFVDSVLSRTKDLFKYRGQMKYYPGREMAEEKAIVFKTRDQFMDYLSKNVLWSAEYVVINQRRSQVSFRLKEETMAFSMNDVGVFTLTDYEDRSVDESKIHAPINRENLIKELGHLFEKLSPKSKGQKKSA